MRFAGDFCSRLRIERELDQDKFYHEYPLIPGFNPIYRGWFRRKVLNLCKLLLKIVPDNAWYLWLENAFLCNSRHERLAFELETKISKLKS